MLGSVNDLVRAQGPEGVPAFVRITRGRRDPGALSVGEAHREPTHPARRAGDQHALSGHGSATAEGPQGAEAGDRERAERTGIGAGRHGAQCPGVHRAEFGPSAVRADGEHWSADGRSGPVGGGLFHQPGRVPAENGARRRRRDAVAHLAEVEGGGGHPHQRLVGRRPGWFRFTETDAEGR